MGVGSISTDETVRGWIDAWKLHQEKMQKDVAAEEVLEEATMRMKQPRSARRGGESKQMDGK
jgi:hypothetical protein